MNHKLAGNTGYNSPFAIGGVLRSKDSFVATGNFGPHVSSQTALPVHGLAQLRALCNLELRNDSDSTTR